MNNSNSWKNNHQRTWILQWGLTRPFSSQHMQHTMKINNTFKAILKTQAGVLKIALHFLAPIGFQFTTPPLSSSGAMQAHRETSSSAFHSLLSAPTSMQFFFFFVGLVWLSQKTVPWLAHLKWNYGIHTSSSSKRTLNMAKSRILPTI